MDTPKTTKILTLEAFYDQHQLKFPTGPGKAFGHFNVFQRNNQSGLKAENIPYSRMGFYKICLLTGRNKVYFGDRTFCTEKNALLFISPQVPYGLELMEEDQSGFFCLFSGSFFTNSVMAVNKFPLFERNSSPFFNLSDEQADAIAGIYLRMQQENSYDSKYRNELIHSLIVKLAFSPMKIVAKQKTGKGINEKSVPDLFFELLEQQFPIQSLGQHLELKSAASFADKLSIHVNYLNRSLKMYSGRTTSELITERVIQEAERMLTRTNWDISEIAWRLGFNQLSYFNTVFKKVSRMTPKTFRQLFPA